MPSDLIDPTLDNLRFSAVVSFLNCVMVLPVDLTKHSEIDTVEESSDLGEFVLLFNFD
jgi:hypothetical protein